MDELQVGGFRPRSRPEFMGLAYLHLGQITRGHASKPIENGLVAGGEFIRKLQKKLDKVQTVC